MSLLHPSCVGGLNESMARTRKWEFFSFVAAMHSGLFPDTVGVEIGHGVGSVINSSLYDY